jgi:para-nitrobenzyl esterase
VTEQTSRTAPPAASIPEEARRRFETPAGVIIGRVDGDVVRATGIRYAESERFAAPRPVPRATEPVLAFERSPGSPQLPSETLSSLIEGAGDGLVADESCQFVSITLPADARPDERLPVMVWIHGGSYVTGAGDLSVYDPRSLVVEQRVIVVAVTYRLGMLGFFADADADAASAADADRIPANLGLLDQLEALRWVHANIEAFGGAADRVTLFGQSAGGDAIAHLMIAEGAEQLFQRAIVQSAPLGITSGRAKMAAAMAAAVGTPARDAPIDELLAQQAVAERAARRFGLRGGMAFGLQYGRSPLPAEADRDAAWRRVAPDIDVLIGTTSEETGLFLMFIPALRRLAALPLVGGLVRRALVGGTTHVIYGRDARAFADRHRASGGRAVRYRMTWAPEGAEFGAAHVTDVPLLLGGRESWGHTRLIGRSAWVDIDRRGRKVRQIWADFARTGTLAADAAAGAHDTITLDRG